MEHFVVIINGFQPLTTITKRSVLDVAAVLDPPLPTTYYERDHFFMILGFAKLHVDNKNLKICLLLEIFKENNQIRIWVSYNHCLPSLRDRH